MDMAAIEAFVSAADGLSFTAAAEVLGITPSGVSKAVSRLEDELKVRLFNRSTRSISLTVDGVVLYERCKQVLNDLNDAKLAMLQAQTAPTGRLRVSMPTVYGRLRVIPAISAFMERYPLVQVEASVTDRMVDVVEEGFDVVVRIGEVPDSRMVARRFSSTRFVVCGSPRYLETHGAPERPRDLRDHACVSFVSPQTRRLMDWSFVENGNPCVHSPSGSLSIDSGEAVVDAAVCGVGLVYCQDYMVEREVAAGTLVRVLDAFAAPAQPVVVMYPQNRHLSPRVRVFVDFMVEHLAALDAASSSAASVAPP
jgi:LysR family transcriptional regulator for bpeEF and oprC